MPTLRGALRRVGTSARLALRSVRSPNGIPSGWITPGEPEPFPAGFNRYASRAAGRMRSPWIPGLRELREQSGPSSPAVVVLMHVYYPELVPEIIEATERIPVAFDLIVTDASPDGLDPQALAPSSARSIRIARVPNHGRDILPMIRVINARLLDGYDLVLKVHTKRSPWRAEHATLGGTGEQWREGFIDELLGSPERVQRILAAFAEQSDLGLVTSAGSIVGPEHWGGDEEIVLALLKRFWIGVRHDDLAFPSGSIYWIRGALLTGLYGLELAPEDFESEQGQIDGTTAHAIERVIGVLTTEAGMRMTAAAGIEVLDSGSWERYAPGAAPVARARVVPFYLPQFHRFAENDEWWGTGFTEWSNVAPARPVFRGHRQPLLPSDLGFYDLTTPGTLDAQWALGSDAGIAGFMYYYYWFSGRKLMESSIEAHLSSNTDAPFAIMWANENWTRTWDGGASDILLGQEHGRVDPAEFLTDVLPLLRDPRYIRVGDAPVIAVYKLGQLPDPVATVAAWRRIAREASIPRIVVLSVDVGTVMEGHDGSTEELGLDGVLEFAPHNKLWSGFPTQELDDLDTRFTGRIMNYGAMADDAVLRLRGADDPTRHPGVMINFDNTPRRQWKSDLWLGSNPYTFRRWLDAAVSAVAERPLDERLVFVNAWNEWAEGAVLEPSAQFGRSYLDAVRSVLLP